VDRPAVVLEDVHAAYEGERTATLEEISFDVSAGEQLAITGPNGAGKTTILEVVNGLLPVASGRVRVFDTDVAADSHGLRAAIAYVPQNLFFAVDTPFLVRDVVFMARFARIRTWDLFSREEHALVGDALRAVGMEAFARRPVGRLSGGQQRKVLLARAITQHARLLLLDEPTANLDPEAKHELAELIATVRGELTATALVVSHDAGPLLDASDRAIHLEAGRIVSIHQHAPRTEVGAR
jgi:ABC-type Mn2+/Zn2+ transport system ATPase subunit